jgi:hypothetical protein
MHALGVNRMAANLATNIACRVCHRLLEQKVWFWLSSTTPFMPALLNLSTASHGSAMTVVSRIVTGSIR